MNMLMLAAVWVHLAACAFLTGSFSLLLMAGGPRSPAMKRWQGLVLSALRWAVIVAILSGIVWLALRTAVFVGRSGAALEANAVLGAMLDTWPGTVWMLRHGLLLMLAAFLWLARDPGEGANRFAGMLEGFFLSALALVLVGASSHSAAVSEDRWPSLVDMVHLLGAGIWAGGLPALVLLLRAASFDKMTVDPYAVTTMRRFSRVAFCCVALLAGTGIVTSSLLVEGVPGLVGTTHGLLLLGKLALLLPALALAAASRKVLPDLSGSPAARPASVARRMALFIALETALVLALLGFAAAMTVNTPARHTDPVWPWPIRLPVDALPPFWSMPGILSVAGGGFLLLVVAVLAWRNRRTAAGLLVLALAGGAGIAILSSAVQAFPTSFKRSPVAYHAASIVRGEELYAAHCTGCDGDASALATQPRSVLIALASQQRTAGELFWLTENAASRETRPLLGQGLDEADRWHVVNYLRTVEAANDVRRIGPEIDVDNGWLVAPDFTLQTGLLAPRALRDFRGRRMVLLVLYSLPLSRERMTELTRRYATLSILGVEVVAVASSSSPAALAELGTNPPVYFPVNTSGNEDIDRAYRLFAPGKAHAEFLIDRQGYIRAMWSHERTGMPSAAGVQAQVERLNEEKAPPPIPDDHIH